MKRSIKGLRADNNLTQKQLAEILGISVHSLQRYEAGESDISFKLVVKLCDYFGIEDLRTIKA